MNSCGLKDTENRFQIRLEQSFSHIKRKILINHFYSIINKAPIFKEITFIEHNFELYVQDKYSKPHASHRSWMRG